MLSESWRVQAWGTRSAEPTHESRFLDEKSARTYYDALELPAKRLQVRRAGTRQYRTIESTPRP